MNLQTTPDFSDFDGLSDPSAFGSLFDSGSDSLFDSIDYSSSFDEVVDQVAKRVEEAEKKRERTSEGEISRAPRTGRRLDEESGLVAAVTGVYEALSSKFIHRDAVISLINAATTASARSSMSVAEASEENIRKAKKFVAECRRRQKTEGGEIDVKMLLCFRIKENSVDAFVANAAQTLHEVWRAIFPAYKKGKKPMNESEARAMIWRGFKIRLQELVGNAVNDYLAASENVLPVCEKALKSELKDLDKAEKENPEEMWTEILRAYLSSNRELLGFEVPKNKKELLREKTWNTIGKTHFFQLFFGFPSTVPFNYDKLLQTYMRLAFEELVSPTELSEFIARLPFAVEHDSKSSEEEAKNEQFRAKKTDKVLLHQLFSASLEEYGDFIAFESEVAWKLPGVFVSAESLVQWKLVHEERCYVWAVWELFDGVCWGLVKSPAVTEEVNSFTPLEEPVVSNRFWITRHLIRLAKLPHQYMYAAVDNRLSPWKALPVMADGKEHKLMVRMGFSKKK